MRQKFRAPELLRDVQNIPLHHLHTRSDQMVEVTQPVAAINSTTPPPLPPVEQSAMPLAALEGVGMQKPRRRGLLIRLQKPLSEELLTDEMVIVKQVSSLGAFPRLMLTNALGLLMVSFSYYISILGYGDVALECLFLLGLLIMFVPNLVRFLSSAPSKLERICSLCGLGLCFYLVEFMASPLHFSSFDDFLHWRTADDILRTSHLFSLNSMLPVSPYYPGLEIVTNAIGTMTGMSTFYAGLLVIVASRLLMVFSLFLLFERLTKASRMSSIAVLIYMANPHFLFFDAIYNYETLALPFATFTFYILVRYEIADKDHRLVMCAAWLMLVVVTITHHMTDYTLVGLLILWALVSLFRPASRETRIHLVALALLDRV